jgi:hypothetical protein
MFFLSFYKNEKKASKLAEERGTLKEEKYRYELDNFWYAYLFGDKNPKEISVQNKYLQLDEIQRHSYCRWLGYGTIFGVSRDSFVGLSNNNFIGTHMQTIYYQMAILCFVQRASILRFNREISLITNEVFNSKANPKKAIINLYEDYICFINQIYFREVTPQIQGIELYALFQEMMGLEKEIKDLDNEMQELFNYLSVQEQSYLSKIAHDFLPLSLLIAFFSLAILNKDFFAKPLVELKDWAQTFNLQIIIATLLFFWLLYLLIKYLLIKRNS